MPTGEWKIRSREGPDTYDNDGLTPHFSPPDREVWHVLSLWVEYTASDTVATRALRVVIEDADDDIIMEIAPGVTLTASQQRDFHFAPGLADLTAARDTDLVTTPLPYGLFLRPGWDLMVIEQSSGDTTDSEVMELQLLYGVENIMSTVGTTPNTTD